MSTHQTASGSRVPLNNQRLPVPPPASVGPSRANANGKALNHAASGGPAPNLSVASGRISQVVARRPSPPRRTGEEMTFQQKLDEIKRMRSRANQNGSNKMTTALLNQVQLHILFGSHCSLLLKLETDCVFIFIKRHF